MRQTKLAWTVLAVTVAVIGVVAVTAMLRSPFSGNGSDPPPAGAEDEGAAAAGDDARAGENDAGAGEAGGKDGAAAGEALFQSQGCGQCHYTDRTENKIGPGLKGLMDRETLSLSGWPATRENVRRQIVDPYDSMPSYEDRLDDAALGRLLDYLATL